MLNFSQIGDVSSREFLKKFEDYRLLNMIPKDSTKILLCQLTVVPPQAQLDRIILFLLAQCFVQSRSNTIRCGN